MDLGLSGHRAIVTGGGGGLGRAIAVALAEEGAAVAVAGRTRASLDATVDAIDAASERGRALAVVADTGDAASVDAMVATVVDRLGGVEILVNCAARPGLYYLDAPGVLAGFDEAGFQLDMSVKVLGYLRCVQAVVPHMRARSYGRIVNVSGLSARRTGSITGSVRNVAVAAMTKNLADELGPQGINVTVVHPGLTRTQPVLDVFTEIAERTGTTAAAIEAQFASSVSIGRLTEAEEVAPLVAFLCSPLSVTINGDAVACGGGDLRAIHY